MLFRSLDLKNAFNLIRIKDGDEWKTAFRTHLGLFEYTVMPFGLTNAPATFQAFIQDTLRDLLDITCVVYIDDILIFSKNQADHDVHVQQVLERLQAAGLYANAKKCEFDKSQVEYLGYLVGADGIKMNPKKLATVSDWPVPRTLRDVQAFLGFTNFYRRFIDRYAEKAGGVGAKRRKRAGHDGEVDEVTDETSRRECDDSEEEKIARVIKSSVGVRTREDRIDAELLALTLRRSRASYAD